MPHWTFSNDNREFVIHTPYTSRPWINYFTNGRYFALVSQTAGGFRFYLDPSHHAITVENPHGKNKGIHSLWVDGKEVAGNRVPVPQQRNVEVHAVIE